MRTTTRAAVLHDLDTTFFSADRWGPSEISSCKQRALLVAKLAVFIYGEIRMCPTQALDLRLMWEGQPGHELLSLGRESPLRLMTSSAKNRAASFKSDLCEVLRRGTPDSFVFSSAIEGTRLASRWAEEQLPHLSEQGDDAILGAAEAFSPEYAAVVAQARNWDALDIPILAPPANRPTLGLLLDELADNCFVGLDKPDEGWHATRSHAQGAFSAKGLTFAELVHAMAPYDLAGIIANAALFDGTPVLRIQTQHMDDTRVLVARGIETHDAVEFNIDHLLRTYPDFVHDLMRATFSALLQFRCEQEIATRLASAWATLANTNDVDRYKRASDLFDEVLEMLRRAIRRPVQIPELGTDEFSIGKVIKLPAVWVARAGVTVAEMARKLGRNIHGAVITRDLVAGSVEATK